MRILRVTDGDFVFMMGLREGTDGRYQMAAKWWMSSTCIPVDGLLLEDVRICVKEKNVIFGVIKLHQGEDKGGIHG